MTEKKGFASSVLGILQNGVMQDVIATHLWV